MAPHSSTLAWKNLMDGAAWKALVHGVAEGRTRLRTFTFTFHFSLSCIGEGNGNPLQCSCLENPRDGGAWWAADYGVTQSRTQLKWLSSSSSVRRASQVVLEVKNILPASIGDTVDRVSIPGSGRFPKVGNANSHQYFCLENAMDRGVWQA